MGVDLNSNFWNSWYSEKCLASTLAIWPLPICHCSALFNCWCLLCRMCHTVGFTHDSKWPSVRTCAYYFTCRNFNIPTWGSTHAKSHTCEQLRSCEYFVTDYPRITCMCTHLPDSNISSGFWFICASWHVTHLNLPDCRHYFHLWSRFSPLYNWHFSPPLPADTQINILQKDNVSLQPAWKWNSLGDAKSSDC